MQKTKDEKIDKDPISAVWRILGLAFRAGCVQTGAEAAEQAIKRRKAYLVLIAADAAGNTVNKLLSQCRRDGTHVRLIGSKTDLGHWTGRDERAVVVILDKGFAKRIELLADHADAADDKTKRLIRTLGG